MRDLIDRAEAIDALDRFSLGETDAVKLSFRMGDYLRRLPSAQPTQTNTLNTLESLDCISRRAAIDAVGNMLRRKFGIGGDLAEITLAGLPSVQSETANIIVGKSRDGMTLWYQCDMCNEPVDENDLYCRGCGRRFEHGSDRQTGGD